MGYKIESKHKLTSEWLPDIAFTTIYDDISMAVATAIEGVEDPEIEEVLVINTDTNEVVWNSTQEKYE